jgi:polyhydroxyalkanoate synthesis regulator phasin
MLEAENREAPGMIGGNPQMTTTKAKLKENNMKSNWKRIGVFAGLIALVGVVGLASVVSAQGPAEQGASGWERGFGWMTELRGRMGEAVAGVLGISVEEHGAVMDTARQQVIEQAVDEGVLSQEQADGMLERMESGFGFKDMPFGQGGRMSGEMGGEMGGRMSGEMGGEMGGRMSGRIGGPENSLISVAADQLGLTVDELLAELEDGRSIADVAEQRGVDAQTIADAYIAVRTERLDEAVAEGRITQEQADEMLAHVTEEMAEHLNEPFDEEHGSGDCQDEPFGDFGRGGQRDGQQPSGRGPGGKGRFDGPLGQAE